jgi:hypothetical protein
LEPIVAAHYTHEAGNKVRKINAVLRHPDPDKAWMLTNIDRDGDNTILSSSTFAAMPPQSAGSLLCSSAIPRPKQRTPAPLCSAHARLRRHYPTTAFLAKPLPGWISVIRQQPEGRWHASCLKIFILVFKIEYNHASHLASPPRTRPGA